MAGSLRLSERQQEIVGLVAIGYSDKQIATRLELSLATVKTYLGRIYRYNAFKNRAEAAVAWARQYDTETAKRGFEKKRLQSGHGKGRPRAGHGVGAEQSE